MSLVRSAGLSATSYRNTKLYSINGSDDCPVLSTQIFGSDKHKTTYMTDSYSSESYEKYFLDSPTEELIQPSSSGISANSFHPDGSSRGTQNPFDTPLVSMRHRDAYQSNFESDYLESESPDQIDYDEDKMRLKLQELERALLDDNDDMFGTGHSRSEGTRLNSSHLRTSRMPSSA